MIYVFLADGFEEIEALAPVDILRRAELPVTTVGIGGKMITGAHGIVVQADCTEDEMDISTAEMVMLPGGKQGTANLDASETVRRSVLWCVENDRYVSAICAAPSVLGHLGVLQGKMATCFPGWESELTGARLCTDSAVQDGKIITGRGAGASLEFGFQLVRALKDNETAESIRASMQTPGCR